MTLLLRIMAIIVLGVWIAGWITTTISFIRRNRWERKRAAFDAHYRNLLISYLEPQEKLPSLRFPGVSMNRFMDVTLILRMLNRLARHLSGVEYRIVLLIFRTNAYYAALVWACYRGGYRWQCRALAIFSNIRIPRNVRYELGHLLYSRSRTVRMFALLAQLHAHPERAMMILRNYPYQISLRAYANIHSLIVRTGIPVENVGILLRSKNRSVAVLGLRLISLLSVPGYEDEIEGLLSETLSARRTEEDKPFNPLSAPRAVTLP